MIYCITQPMDQYNVTIGNETVGLDMTYGHHPPLLNLILLTTLTPFNYEQGTALEPAKRIVQLVEEEKFVETLSMEVKSKKVSRLVSKLSPVEFYYYIREEDISHLPVCDYYADGQVALKMINAARAVTWALNYRGPVKQEGNLTIASFRKDSINIPADMRNHYEEFVDALTKNRD